MQDYETAPEQPGGPDRRYSGLPIVFLAGEPPTAAPFLMSRDEVIRFFRLHQSGTRFPAKAIQRYRHLGLRTVRIGRCAWYRLDDALRFLDGQQNRLPGRTGQNEKGLERGGFG